MTKIKKTISKFLLGLAILFSVSIFASVAHADFLQSLEDLLYGDEELTFQQFEGQLSELDPGGYDSALVASTDLKEFIIKVVNFALTFLGLIAVIIVIYGGVLYVTAGGEEERTQKGKKAISYAVIGLLIVLGSFAFVNTIIRGGIGGVEEGSESGSSQSVIGKNVGGSFNASASEVQSLAVEMYNGYLNLAEVTEDLKNIKNDINKSSLSYTHVLLPYTDMLNFLTSVKGKLTNLKDKMAKFSSGYVRANDAIREIDTIIDEIKVIDKDEKTFAKIEDEKIVFCFKNQPTGEQEEIEAKYEECENDGYTQYPQKLEEKWNEVKEQFYPSAGSGAKGLVDPIIEPIKKDYLKILGKSLARIHEIRNELKGIDAVEQGSAGLLFEEMETSFGYTMTTYLAYIKATNLDEFAVNNYNSGFLREIKEWDINDVEQINRAGEQLFISLEKLIEFSKAIAKLKSVEAHLRANVTKGNAPLYVRFDVLESIDPAGGSIVDSNVIWTNLEGTTTYEGEQVAIDPLATDCTLENNDDEELYGPAFRECIFKHPGTYVATITIKSNEPTKYIAGMSSVVIQVLPPNTKIELTVFNEKMMSYNKDTGILLIDKDYIPITLTEAEAGITFDASATENVANFKWDFGNGQIIEEDSIGKHSDIKYKKEGIYKIELEVRNKLGEIDRKTITLDVRAVAARIKVLPEGQAFVDEPVDIDGTTSSVAHGNITSYNWAISKDEKEIDIAASNKNKPSFTHTFETPGIYEIDLEITSDIDNQAVSAETQTIEIVSQEPVAVFDYSMIDINKPAIFQFDGTKSYDPDGTSENLLYEWSVQPVDADPVPFSATTNITPMNATFVDSDYQDKKPKIEFLEKGEYEVTLKITDKTTLDLSKPESDSVTRTIKIEDILDIAWAEGQQVTAIMEGKDGAAPEAVIDFGIVSKNGKAYEIDFDDKDIDSDDIDGKATISHAYTKTGKYKVKVTVFDDDDNDKSMERTIFIGDADLPVAKISLFVNGVEIYNLNEKITVNRSDVITFDGSESKNIDGTGRKLKYSWNFDDTNKSSNKSATHSYDELSPEDKGHYLVTLDVFDKDNPKLTNNDSVEIDVVNKLPEFSGLQALPQAAKGELITPIDVTVKVHGAEDKDGEIVQYKWWYYDVDDEDEPLGLQITTNPTALMTIGINGKENQRLEYGFGVEIMDNDNNKVSTLDLIDQGEIEEADIPIVEVKNGPNEMPIAAFNVDRTKIYVGEEINFSSSSKDPDGEIEKYIWDIEGDGFSNNTPTDKANFTHTYDAKNLDGYEVKLKVIDNNKGESISDPIKIYVDSEASPPTAAFKYEVVKGTDGKKIQFKNNSSADAEYGLEIKEVVWDFDTKSSLGTADTDGDGQKDNDKDSIADQPTHLYSTYGKYSVKLSITDSEGNQDEVTNEITIPLANPPVAAFTYEINDNELIFKNNSSSDTDNGAEIIEYIWDFDTMTEDSDGDGTKDNDTDSKEKEPKKEYKKSGKYQVKLTVKDDQGNMDEVVNEVDTANTSNIKQTGGDGGDIFGNDVGTTNSGSDEEMTELEAILTTKPAPAEDGVIYLEGEGGSVVFDFSDSEGAINTYIFDKNINFDTDNNGESDDDENFKTSLPGTWKTNFEKAWGKITVKLTVKDIYGNSHSILQEIKFK